MSIQFNLLVHLKGQNYPAKETVFAKTKDEAEQKIKSKYSLNEKQRCKYREPIIEAITLDCTKG